jgi:hypothetical protein
VAIAGSGGLDANQDDGFAGSGVVVSAVGSDLFKRPKAR